MVVVDLGLILEYYAYMNVRLTLDFSKLTEPQGERLEILLQAAERAKKLHQPDAYKKAMFEVYTYYLQHHQDTDLDQKAREARATQLVGRLPKVKGPKMFKMTLWRAVFLLGTGVAGAFVFLRLFAQREKLKISGATLMTGLILFTAFLIMLPAFFPKSKK